MVRAFRRQSSSLVTQCAGEATMSDDIIDLDEQREEAEAARLDAEDVELRRASLLK